MKTRLAILAISLGSLYSAQFAAAGPMMAEPQPVSLVPESPWSFDLVPYAWLPGIEGTTGVRGLTTNVDVGPDDVIDNLDFAASAMFAARYNRVGIITDVMYVKLSPSYETPGPLFGRTDLTLEQTMVDLKGSYRLYETERAFLDIAAGARYFNVDIDLTLQPGILPTRSTSGSEGWWDAVA